jgi:sugar transferase (PEP-CTERM/EpsH1 system associated)
MTKIKITHVLSRFDVGGLENGVVNLCNGHDLERFEPSILCVKGTGLMAGRLKKHIPVHCLNAPEGKDFFRFLRLAAHFRRHKPDIVHTHGWGATSLDGIIGARLAGVRTVINGEHGTFCNKPYQVYIQRFLSTLCNATLSVSHAHKEKVVQVLGINPKRIKVIHNGVDTGKFSGTHDVAPLKAELRDTFAANLSAATFYIGCVGSLKTVKNQHLLIKAASHLKLSNPNIPAAFLFAGIGPDLQMLKELAVKLDVAERVFFLGERQNIPEFLSLIDLLVLPSQTGKEGLPNVVLEAMSSGKPIISTRSVGTAEVMAEGETGRFLQAEAPADLASILLAFINNPSQTKAMGAAARNHIINNFSIQKMVQNYENLYLNSCSKMV